MAWEGVQSRLLGVGVGASKYVVGAVNYGVGDMPMVPFSEGLVPG